MHVKVTKTENSYPPKFTELRILCKLECSKKTDKQIILLFFQCVNNCTDHTELQKSFMGVTSNSLMVQVLVKDDPNLLTALY